MSLLGKLVKIANQLDEKGLYDKADEIDKIIQDIKSSNREILIEEDNTDDLQRRELAPKSVIIPPITTGGPAPAELTKLPEPKPIVP